MIVGSNGIKLPDGTTVGQFLALGAAGEVEITMTGTGYRDTGWLALAASLFANGPENRGEAIELVGKALDTEPNYVLDSHQKEQLWGPKLRSTTAELFKLAELKPVVDRALANASPVGESSDEE